jgi:hypothetical protein
MLKLEDEERFVEQYKKRVYRIDDKCEVEECPKLVDSDMKKQLKGLSYIIGKHPQNYKDLIELKSKLKLANLPTSICTKNNKEEVL